MKKFSLYTAGTVFYGWLKSRSMRRCGRSLRLHFPAILRNPGRMSIGNGVTIFGHCLLNCQELAEHEICLEIGDRCSFGRFLQINAYERVVIESDVLVGERVHISDASHRYDDPSVPIMDQGAEFRGPVRICRGAWIGCGAVILPGVTVGRNAVVAANAVVTRDVPENQVARGVPARNFPKAEKANFAVET